jgi:hypothetical protein
MIGPVIFAILIGGFCLTISFLTTLVVMHKNKTLHTMGLVLAWFFGILLLVFILSPLSFGFSTSENLTASLLGTLILLFVAGGPSMLGIHMAHLINKK